MAHAWKVCVRQRTEGSNPSLSAKIRFKDIYYSSQSRNSKGLAAFLLSISVQ